jgi:formate/nitrite transporter FocA (FNT family)
LLVISNLALVTTGNILDGTILVTLIYWFVYLRAEGEGLAVG